jgi:hypothetical protein
MRNITWRVYGGRSVNEIVFEVVREGDMQEDMTVVIPDPTGRPAKWLPDVIKKTSQKTAAPLAARRFIEDELIPTLYRAYYTQGKEDNRIWNRDEDRIAENTWEKVVYTVAQLDTDYLAVFKKLMAPFPKVPKDGLSFSEMRDYGWSSY